MEQRQRAPRQHTISVLLENKDGVLSRVTGLFSARGYALESITLGPSLDPLVARMIIVVRGDERVIEQVIKQLQKLIEVIKVADLTDVEHVGREMLLVRVVPHPDNRAEVVRIADIFRARLVDVTPDSYVLEVTGERSKINAILELLRPFGIAEVVRTGTIAMARGRLQTGRRPVDPRRKYPRQAAAFEVRLGSMNALARLWAHDISKGGMSLKTDRELALGTTVQLRFIHPQSGEPFPLSAVVRRHIAHPNFRGVGVEFVAMDEASRARLGEFMVGVSGEMGATADGEEADGEEALDDLAGPRRELLGSREP